MKKLLSRLRVASVALCLTLGVGAAADECGCQTCSTGAQNCNQCSGNCYGSGCLTCENIWDGYCASKQHCIHSPMMHRHFGRRGRRHQGCCPDNGCADHAGVGVYGYGGAPSCGHSPGAWKSLKSKFHNPFVYTTCATGACDVPPAKACDDPPAQVCDAARKCDCDAPPKCDCRTPANCDCDAPSTDGDRQPEPDAVVRGKPASSYKFEYANVGPAAENWRMKPPEPEPEPSEAAPPASPVVREMPRYPNSWAEDPYPLPQTKATAKGKAPTPFNWLKRTFSGAD